MDVLVVGSVAYDTVETPFGTRERALGGSATYFSAAARYFASVNLVGTVGRDFDEADVAFLRDRGVDVTGLQRVSGDTFTWHGKYGYDLNERETLSVCLNVFEDFHPDLPEKYAASPWVFLGNIHPALQHEVLDQITAPKFTAFDTMDLWINTERKLVMDLLPRVDAIVLNDSEARAFAEEPNLIKAARKIQEWGCDKVLIKKGEHGCLAFLGETFFAAPAFPLENIFDPTGAGDTFAGGFMGYLARSGDLTDYTLRRGIIFGSVMASFTCEAFSVDRIADLTEADIVGRYNEFRAFSHFDW